MDLDEARVIAKRYSAERSSLDLEVPRETVAGWYFPPDGGTLGFSGIVINKTSGRVLELGSAFPVERDLHFYDQGYQSEAYDLVVLRTNDHDATVGHLLALDLSVVVPEYEGGTVWRVPRILTEAEVRSRLDRLPCVFDDVALYFHLEVLDEVEQDGSFEFKAIPITRPPRSYEGRATRE